MITDPIEDIVPEAASALREVSAVVQKLVATAFRDPLTRLLNGVALKRFEAAKERAYAFGAIFVDLTGFKHLNDEHGHEAGDAALNAVGQVLGQVAERTQAYAFHTHGDEFVLLTRNHDKARECAQAIADKLGSGILFRHETHELRVAGAVGFSLLHDSEATLSQLIREADAACQLAKDQGDGQAVEWKPEVAKNPFLSLRFRCPTCTATTAVSVRQSARHKTPIICGNCGQPLSKAPSKATETPADL